MRRSHLPKNRRLNSSLGQLSTESNDSVTVLDAALKTIESCASSLATRSSSCGSLTLQRVAVVAVSPRTVDRAPVGQRPVINSSTRMLCALQISLAALS